MTGHRILILIRPWVRIQGHLLCNSMEQGIIFIHKDLKRHGHSPEQILTASDHQRILYNVFSLSRLIL